MGGIFQINSAIFEHQKGRVNSLVSLVEVPMFEGNSLLTKAVGKDQLTKQTEKNEQYIFHNTSEM
jgi:hypothetical protein